MQLSNKSMIDTPPVFPEKVPTLVNKTGLWRFLTPVYREKMSPCQNNCPLDTQVPRWIGKIKEDNWREAWEIMEQYNPFPALTGHICYRFCQEDCSRGQKDESIDIGELEKAVGYWRHENYQGQQGERNNQNLNLACRDKSIAVVGSGPTGLTCAYYLNKLGARVTVLERFSEPGGLLATAVPPYRLPRNILARELEILREEGIEFKTGITVGDGVSLQDVRAEFDAVLLAVGAQKSRSLGVEGSSLKGVVTALEFLQEAHLDKKNNVEDSVVVVGGGNAAVDAACTAKLQGASQVTLLYRRQAEAMPAHPEEIEAARLAGVNFVFEAVVEEILGEGKVEKVQVAETAPSSRGEPVKVLPGTRFHIDCGQVLVAAGQESSLPEIVPAYSFTEEEQEGAAFLGRGNSGSAKLLFAAGDALTGPANVAEAIFNGRRAALMLEEQLGREQNEQESSSYYPAPASRNKEGDMIVSLEQLNPALYPNEGVKTSSREEARRCFSCGLCSNCGICWTFCPDLAVEYAAGEYSFLLDYCKGCGICVRECPAGVLEMEVDADGT